MPSPPTEHARWFTNAVHAHDASLKRYLRRSFPSVRDIDDLVQESYLRAWRRHLARPIAEVSESVTASVKGFLFQVARRLALDTLRRDRRSPIDARAVVQESTCIDEGMHGGEAACTQQEFELLLEAIDSLPPRCREVIVMRKLHGLSPAETAAALGIAEETVHAHARNAIPRLQEALRRRGVSGRTAP